jgi:3-deoxy-D-manno-octulosonic-acid transferase
MKPLPTRSSFYFFYRTFFWPLFISLFRALGHLHPKILPKTLPKIRATLQMRERRNGTWPWLAGEGTPPGIDCVWIHCASGEFEYAKPVITLLKSKSPETRVLVTHLSPSVTRAVRSFPGVDFACPLPWDQPAILQEFLAHHRPKVLMISRTDAWPEMLRQAKSHGLVTLLFSATLARESGRAKGIGSWMSKAVFAHLDRIFCVTEADREVFASLGFKDRTQTAGDTRYDQVIARLSAPRPLRQELFSGVDPARTLVCGSTWKEDEDVILKIAERWRSRVWIVLIPHEPTEEHLEELEKSVLARGLRSIRYSKSSAWEKDTVLLVDEIGILAELYQQGSLAFVGGSFKKSVHSVMEPLAAGCITFVGPFHKNNREALEFRDVPAEPGSQAMGCVQVVHDAESFSGALERALARLADPASDIPSSIRNEVRERSGKSEIVVTWALDQLRLRH